MREQRSGAQVDQIAAFGAERSGVLDAGIGLDNLNTCVVATGGGDASTPRAELRIVDGVKKVPPARQHLRPGIQPIDGVWRSSRPGDHARVLGVGNQQAVRAKGDRGAKVRDVVREDLTRGRVYRDTAQLALRGKQQRPAVGSPDDGICALAVDNRTGLQFREVTQEEAE